MCPFIMIRLSFTNYQIIKMKKYKTLLYSIGACCLFSCQSGLKAPKAPDPVLPIPEPKQVEWQKMETYAFVHFGLNSFNDREWGYGDSDPKTFNPTKLDCEQWVKTFVNSGMKGVIITAKHHDGFCLWPTKLTEYCIRNSPYKHGEGDILKELSEACKKYGIKFGVYLSPWDRNHAKYGSPEYVDYYHKQLREILSNYGETFEVWFDGANGGDGWYGGAKESRTIDRKNYYNYPRLFEIINEIQPNAIIFTDGGPGARWVGNESGYAGATNWSFLRKGVVHPAYPKYRELQYGHADGNQWVAAECDVSIRPGWFYHPEEDDKVKTVDQLTDLYYRSVGHNATLLLNFPVDRNGLINPVDSANAVNFYKNIQKQLSENLFKGIVAEVSDERGDGYTAKFMTDGNYDTYWATHDSVFSATATFDLKKSVKVNRMMIQEYIPLGQRVKSFVVEYETNGKWEPVSMNEETTTVGYKRLLRFKTVATSKIRIRFTDSRGCLTINNVEAYYAGETNDISFVNNPVEMNSYPFDVVNVQDKEALAASDREISTTLLIKGDEIVVDLGKECTISSFHYLPDQSEYNKGLIANFQLSVGNEVSAINHVVKEGEFSNIKNNPILQSIYFTPVTARFVKLKAKRMVDNGDEIGVAEIFVK